MPAEEQHLVPLKTFTENKARTDDAVMQSQPIEAFQ
jgi:hypothetical protein